MSVIEKELKIDRNTDKNSPEFRKKAEEFWNNPNNFQEPWLIPGSKLQAWLGEVNKLPWNEKERTLTQASLDGTISRLCQEDIHSDDH